MTLDFATLESLRTRHPAWRLLRSDHAPLVASFLQRVFVAPNVRVMAAAEFMNCQPGTYEYRVNGGENRDIRFDAGQSLIKLHHS